jgi:hypothetical protein
LCSDDFEGDCLLSGVSGQSGSSLPASQFAALVRPPRASATVIDDMRANTAKAALNLYMDASVHSANQHGIDIQFWGYSNQQRERHRTAHAVQDPAKD